jgi:hypothetical protein
MAKIIVACRNFTNAYCVVCVGAEGGGGVVIKHAMRKPRILLSSVASPAVPNFFPHYLLNVTIFGRNLWNIKCVFCFSLQFLSETFLILRRIKRDIIKNVYWSLCKVSAILIRSE